jgi:Putative zinc-finger
MTDDGIEDVNRHSSNPLIQELTKGPGAEPHPDEDVLTAFVENALLPRERDGVMEHLAVCAACREVLSLAAGAMPEAAIQEKLHVLPARPAMRSWLPWVTVAAGVIAVSSLVVVHERVAKIQATPGNAPMNLATEAPPPPILPPSDLPQPEARTLEQATAVPAAKPSQLDRLATPQHQESELKKLAPVAAEQADSANVEQQNYSSQSLGLASRTEEKGAVAPVAAPAPAAPPVSAQNETVNVTSASAQIETRDEVLRDTLPAQAKARAGSGSANGPAAARQAAPAFSGNAGVNGVLSGTSARTRWRINGEGRVERLAGSGQWQAVLPGEKSRMRVVSVFDDMVWVGGESLRLYSSNDNGASWKSAALPEKGGAHVITHIRFTSKLAGTAEAEGGMQWSTTDGGLTWK